MTGSGITRLGGRELAANGQKNPLSDTQGPQQPDVARILSFNRARRLGQVHFEHSKRVQHRKVGARRRRPSASSNVVTPAY
jgi:hypothetical protein